jgi:hypothetical protein
MAPSSTEGNNRTERIKKEREGWQFGNGWDESRHITISTNISGLDLPVKKQRLSGQMLKNLVTTTYNKCRIT